MTRSPGALRLLTLARSRVARFVLSALCLGLGTLGTGCGMGRELIAPSADYGDYRRVRVAESLDDRLSRAWFYLHEHPAGVYRPPVLAWFTQAEAAFYEVHRRDEAGLERYLQALPSGPHATAARAELMRLRLVARVSKARAVSIEETTRRMDAERQRREAVAAIPVTWIEMLLDPALASRPLDQAPDAFLVRYRLELPSPVCNRDVDRGLTLCSKLSEAAYEVVENGENVARKLVVGLELDLDDTWRVRTARVFGPALLLRALEASERKPLNAADRAERERAALAFEEDLADRLKAKGHRCEVLLGTDWALRCGARRVIVRPGDGEEDDTVTLEPAP